MTGRRVWTAVDRQVVRQVVGLGLAAFLFGYLVTALFFVAGSSRADVVTVPDLRTMTLARARRMLDRSDLRLEVGDSMPNPRVARGAVLAQSPLPGQEVGPESRIRVILSRGPDRRVIPRVTTYAPVQAERILAASGFRVEVRSVPDLRAKGRVVGTIPGAGAAAQVSGTIRLLVSSGPPVIAVPDVAGMSEQEARAVLQGVMLRVGAVDYRYRPELAPGVVISHSPAAGDSVVAGNRVTLQVVTHDPPELPAPVEQLPAAVETPTEQTQ